MPFGGGLSARFGCRIVIALSAIVMGLSLPFLVFSTSMPMLAVGLLLLGAGGGTLDVAMNVQAVIVEEAAGKPMMSGFHGMFSVGGVVGAGLISLGLASGFSPQACQLGITTLFFLLLALTALGNLPFARKPEGERAKLFVLPRGRAIVLGLICFIVFMAEGSVADWSGVLLTNYRHADPSKAGLGFVAFASMMTLNRLTGDLVVARVGRKRIVLFGTVLAALGFLLTCFVPFWPVSILGFAFVGIGLANVVPITFTGTARQSDMPPSQALSAVSTMGYVGLLVGPPLIGMLAKSTSLLVSLACLAGACLCVATQFRAKEFVET